MPIQFECPECNQKIRAPDSAAGKTSRCPACGNPVTAPEPIYEAEALPEPPPAPPRKQNAYDDLDDGSPYALEGPEEAPAAPGSERRRPCPVCGELIVATAAKCRFCGEIFDDALRTRSADPETLVQFRKNIHGLGGAWIFFGIVVGIVAAASFAAGRAEAATIAVVLAVLAVLWFSFGVFACMKHLWAVYAGLALCYLSLVGNIVNLASPKAAPGAMGGAVVGLIIILVVIFQGHRTLSLAGRLKRARIPLTAKP